MRMTTNTEFVRLGFKSYKKVFDLKSFGLNNTQDSVFKYDPKMLSIRQLNGMIDSLHKNDSFYAKRVLREMDPSLLFTKYADTGWVKTKPLPTKAKSFAAEIPDSIKRMIYERSLNQINSAKSTISMIEEDYKTRQKVLSSHEIEWHRKFTLSVACFVLFLIGAPLGAIIRKGGLGAPLVFAIAFFVVFYLLNTFGERLAHEGVVSVFFGMWLSTIVLIPVGVFLTYKAMHDSQLFNQEAYYRIYSKLKQFVATFRFNNSSSKNI